VRAIQRDFGGVDLRFLGVTVRIDTETFWRHLSGQAVPESGSTSEDLVEKVCAASVLEHETRHFHDFLISPAGAQIVRARTALYLASTRFIRAIPDTVWNEGTCLPVPLTTWCAKTADERQEYLAYLNAWPGRGDQSFSAPNLPHIEPTGWKRFRFPSADDWLQFISAPDLTHIQSADCLLQLIHANYEMIRDILLPAIPGYAHVDFLPMHVSEASAFAVQFEKVGAIMGDEAVDLLADQIRSVDRYGTTYGILAALNDHGCDGELISAVMNWAQCGRWPRGGVSESSSMRCASLVRFLLENPLPPSDTPIPELYEEWSKRLGRTLPYEAVEESVRLDGEYLEYLVAMEANAYEPWWAMTVRNARRFYETFAAARAHCIHYYCHDHDTYVRPLRYLTEARTELTMPPLALEIRAKLTLDMDALESAGFKAYRLFRARHDEHSLGRRGLGVLGAPMSPDAKSQIDRDLAFDWAAGCITTDALFSPSRADVEDADLYLARNALADDRALVRLIHS
jgi:hypothetical protein